MRNKITVSTTVNAPVQQAWQYFNAPEHIVNWNFAHESWACPNSQNDLKVGGKFSHRMEAKDGSFGFDFEGVYDTVVPNEKMDYTLGDGRKVTVDFEKTSDNATTITQIFEPENQNPEEMQKQGWQAILDNFKNYVASQTA